MESTWEGLPPNMAKGDCRGPGDGSRRMTFARAFHQMPGGSAASGESDSA
jgi:hypothetical protein